MLKKWFLLVSLVGGFLLTSAALAASWKTPPLLADADACAPLPLPAGTVVKVSTVDQLVNAVNNANPGDIISLADGNYNLDGIYLRLDTPNISVRSTSGNREAVILDGNYQTTEIIQVVASNVTIANLTLREAYDHPIHVMSGNATNTLNTLIYNVHIIDPGQQAVKINPATTGYYADNGVIACSHIELTDTGRTHIRNNCYTGGIDMHQGRGWVFRDNLIEGFWCASGLSEHGIHLWRGGRDNVIERNVFNDNARGIGLGMATSGTGRTYTDNACPSASGYVDDFGGVIRNNFISANSSALFASQDGFDCGICLWNACNAQALHNTVYTANPSNTFSSIEWRFPNTRATITNNLVNHTMRERDSAFGIQAGNLTNATASWFASASTGDLHLTTNATNAIDQASALSSVTDDIDGDPRPLGSAPDIGADEYGFPPPAAVTDLQITQDIKASGTVTITLAWTPPGGAELQAIRYATAPITDANWASATPLNDALCTCTMTYTVTLPYTSGTLYFAHKSYNAAGGWSKVSNNVFWPHFDIYLPSLYR
jgi:hypothetical protein